MRSLHNRWSETGSNLKERIIILGSGFGAVRLLQGLDTSSYEVVLVSPRNYFLFTPLLASSAVGTIEFRSIVEPIRLASDEFQYYQASCTGVDSERRSIKCQSASGDEQFSLRYDYLVIAVGASTSTFGVPGVEKYALFLKDIPDARMLRSRIIQCFELANEPQQAEDEKIASLHFVVVGGGPTGVEFAAELHDLITEDLAKRYPGLVKLARISVLEGSDKLLGTFDNVLSGYTARAFKRQNIEVRTGALVTKLEAGKIFLKDGSVVSAGLILWSAGIGPAPLVASLAFPKMKSRILTDSYLAIPEHPEIFAIGDCSSIVDRNLPLTGQLAQSEGKYLARMFNRKLRGKSVEPFSYFNKGMLAYVGSGKALMDTPGLKGRGFLAWLLWRSIYLTKLVSLRNKVSVLFDWLRTFFFGRDFSKF